jgi:hypothetical protein
VLWAFYDVEKLPPRVDGTLHQPDDNKNNKPHKVQSISLKKTSPVVESCRCPRAS